MPDAPSATLSFDEVGALVRAILRRKSGMSLRADDTRADNVDAVELYHDVIARLWERQAQSGEAAAAWSDVGAYAATVTHNAWSDHLRHKHPKRASLKNRLRYFLGHQQRYASWESVQGETVAGLHAWLLQGLAPAGEARLQALREGRDKLPAGSVPRHSFERFTAADWDRLLAAVFARLGAPVVLDALVGLVASLVGLQEDRTESLDDDGDGVGSAAAGVADAAAADPERAAEIRGMLRALWGAVLALKPDYRRAYLLNLPGPGKMRADIDVFVMHGVASIEEIAAALDLGDARLAMALDALPLSAAERAALARCADATERFCVLWAHLPLSDALIGQLLDLAQQQVINRRMLALRELARLVGHVRPRSQAAPPLKGGTRGRRREAEESEAGAVA